jgi:hypothetical protein
MKQFNELRKGSEKPAYSKKFQGIPIEVHKEKTKYVAIVDGDILDEYKTEKEAVKAAEQFIKQFKGMK